jgi:hypothetical protein
MTASKQKLRKAVEAWMKANRDSLAYGAKLYSRDEWEERGERYGNGAALTMVIDGAGIYRVLNYPESKADFDLYDRFYRRWDRYGFYCELGFGWSLHFYPTPGGEAL